jgi:cysteine desulfurase
MLSVSAHKFYGPKGVGVLFFREGIGLKPFLLGGKQERGWRAGTENVAGIAGAAFALELACATMEEENGRLSELRDHAERRLADEVEGAVLNGRGARRLPNYINISLPGVKAESALIYLDAAGIECSSGSACAAGSINASHVLEAIGLDRDTAKRSLRLTLGAATTRAQIDYAVDNIIKICRNAAALQKQGVNI